MPYININYKIKIFTTSLLIIIIIKGFEEFANCDATIKFTRYLNNIFDTLNSKEIVPENPYKSAITVQTKSDIFKFFDDAINYLKGLQLVRNNKKIPILKSKKKSFVRGYIVNMHNVKLLYEYVIEKNRWIDSLPVFRIGQDPLESFFGRVRSLGGYNDNPTHDQFISAYRKISVHNEIRSSKFANCEDSLNVLTVSSRSTKTKEKVDDEQNITEQINRYLSRIDENPNEDNVDVLEEASIAYIAGVIEKKIENYGRFSCNECLYIFRQNDKTETANVKSTSTRNPCISTFKICKTVNTLFKIFKRNLTFTYDGLVHATLYQIDLPSLYSKTNFEGHESHKYDFAKFVTEEFIRIHATTLAQNITLDQQKLMLRNKLKKIINFQGL